MPFGGKYRIIDFPPCPTASTRGSIPWACSQYQPLELNAYLGNGAPWDLDRTSGGVYIAAALHEGARAASGTRARPRHIRTSASSTSTTPSTCWCSQATTSIRWTTCACCSSTPSTPPRHHRGDRGAAVEASRFGIMNTLDDRKNLRVRGEAQAPQEPEGLHGRVRVRLAQAAQYLIADEADPRIAHDFGRTSFPAC